MGAIDVSVVTGWVLTVLAAVALVAVVVTLATDEREPSIVLAWLFVLVLLPVVGLVAYFFVGRDHRRPTRRRTRSREAERARASTCLAPTLTAQEPFTAAVLEALEGPDSRMERVGRREGWAVPLPADDVRVYVAGADKFRDLLEDLRGAEKYVDLMYLIWEKDDLTAQVTEILLDRLTAGVEVHILYDWVTCLPYKKTELKQLERAGATVVPCYRRLAQLNYRNHMKIAIVDGTVVYSGGMNMGQEYADGGERFAEWRDTHVRMTGAVVAPYLWLFASVWTANGRTEDLFTGYLPESPPRAVGEALPAQVLHSSVSTDFAVIRDVFVAALLNARRRVWIQSPYFVPDEPLLTAMCVAAAGGVDVRFMMTGVPDKKVPFYAAHGYYRTLLHSGVRVFQYRAGFLHAKTVTVDDDVAIIGTCNWDIRSIILHDEVVSVFYDGGVARDYAEQYEKDLGSCAEITLEDLAAISRWQRFRNSVYRLFSRLL